MFGKIIMMLGLIRTEFMIMTIKVIMFGFQEGLLALMVIQVELTFLMGACIFTKASLFQMLF